MDAKFIQTVICKSEIQKGNYACESVKFIYEDWEIDVLSFNERGYSTDFEVKVSRGDFAKDKTKKKHPFYLKGEKCPNYLYYVCPEGVLATKDVMSLSEKYGLIYIHENGKMSIVKKAQLLHRDKCNPFQLMRKFLSLYQERKFFGITLSSIRMNKSKKSNEQTTV